MVDGEDADGDLQASIASGGVDVMMLILWFTIWP